MSIVPLCLLWLCSPLPTHPAVILRKPPIQEKSLPQMGNPECLEGIQAVAVIVSIKDESEVKAGSPTTTELKERVELKLRQSGIKVNEIADLRKDFNVLPLLLRVHLVHVTKDETARDPEYLFNMDISISDCMTSIRPPRLIMTRVVIWADYIALGLYPRSALRQILLEQADVYATKFCNDYLKANPKK